MKTNHLSAWEQEEYVLDQRTPQMLRHLADCADCRAAVAQLEHGVAVFRNAAVEWSAECLGWTVERSKAQWRFNGAALNGARSVYAQPVDRIRADGMLQRGRAQWSAEWFA